MGIKLKTPTLIGSRIPKGVSDSILFIDSNGKLAGNSNNTHDGLGNVKVGTSFGIGVEPSGNEFIPLDINGLIIKLGPRTDNTTKTALFVATQYDIDEPGVIGFGVQNTLNQNAVTFGGGNANLNAATDIDFYTANTVTTRTGTRMLSMSNANLVEINPSKADIDTIIYGDTSEAMRVDASTHRIGIGTDTPLANVHLSASAQTAMYFTEVNNDATYGFGSLGGFFRINSLASLHGGTDLSFMKMGLDVEINPSKADIDTIIYDDTSEIMRVDASTHSILINTNKQLQFGDSGTYINQGADGHLDLTADVSIDMNGLVNMEEGQKVKITEVTTATYNILATDYHLSHQYSNTGTSTITFPAISADNHSQVYSIKDADYNSFTNNITLNPTGSDKIDNSTSQLISSDGTTVKFIANNTTKNWELGG